MNLPQISEALSLAIHAVAFLAGNNEGLVTTRQIAERFDVSEAHLSKVLQRLEKSGLIKSARGPKGGYKLLKNPEKITLMDVYEVIEGPMTEQTCLLAHQPCGGNECIFGNLLNVVFEQYKTYFSGTKIAEFEFVKRKKANKDS